MMTHQLKRLNTIGLMVVSHDAQFFPLIHSDHGKILFDKIYPDKIKLFENMYSIITRYTGIVNRGKKNMYYDYKNIKN